MTLQAVIDMAVQTGPCNAASITALGDGKTLSTIAASDDRVRKADHLQYQFSEGPCLDAVWTDGIFIIPDLSADGRWPRWAPEANRLGIGLSMSVHLFADTRLGSLNMYSTAPRTFTDTDVENGRVIAAQACRRGRLHPHPGKPVAHDRQPQSHRPGTGNADAAVRIGEKAFAVLRRYSQTHNIKLARIAEQLTTTGILPGLDDAPPPGTEPI